MSPQQQASQKAAEEAARFVDKVNDIILFPLIALLVGVALLIFLWGCSQYIFNANNESARAEGRQHILFGIIGLVVIMSAYAIIQVAVGTFGLQGQLDCANNPVGGDCRQMFQVQ